MFSGFHEIKIQESAINEDWKDDFEVAYINGVRQLDTNDDGIIDKTIMDVVKIKSGVTTPNTPYLIKSKTTGEKTISVNNATLHKSEEKSEDCSRWFLRGRRDSRRKTPNHAGGSILLPL